MSEQYITESYLRQSIEQKVFTNVIAIMKDAAYSGAGGANRNWGALDIDMHDWLNGNIYGLRYGNRVMRIFIDNRFYRAGGSVTRGDPVGESDGFGTTGQYTAIRNHARSDIVHQVDKTVTLTESQSSSMKEGIQLDITAKGSAGYAGMTAELETHLGITMEAEQARSSSKETSTTFSDTITIAGKDNAPPNGEEVAIVYSKGTKRYSQDFRIDALSDCGFWVHLYHWDKHGSASRGMKLANSGNDQLWSAAAPGTSNKGGSKDGEYWFYMPSINDFCGFCQGYDVRARYMIFYARHGAVISGAAHAALNVLQDGTIMNLQLDGTNTVIADGDADYNVEDITGLSDDDVKDRYGEPGNPVGDTLRLVC